MSDETTPLSAVAVDPLVGRLHVLAVLLAENHPAHHATVRDAITEIERLEALCDTNYAAGVGAGWNCGVDGDAERRDRIIEAHSLPALAKLRELKTHNV